MPRLKAAGNTQKKKNCNPSKSFPCGYSCQALGRNCRKALSEKAAQQLQWLEQKDQRQQKTIETYKKRLQRRDQKLADIKSRPAYPTAPAPGSVMDIDVNELTLDPKRFQYKLVHGKTGSSGSLTGVRKWDPNLAGIIQVWRDPSDGKTYIVNGHNRANLAKELGADKVTVRFLDVRDAKEARAVGALTNIAEGRGNALDAAKFFRDSGISRQQLEERGIPLREKIATDGLAVSQLPDDLFSRVILGDIDMARAAQLGGSGLDHAQQRSLLQLVEKTEKKKAITQSTFNELLDIVKSSTSTTSEQFDLFGSSVTTQNLALEKARIQSGIRQKLSQEKNLFGRVATSRAAEKLKEGGNVIESDKNREIADEADIGMRVFDQLKNVSSPVSQLINEATERIANGEPAKQVETELYSKIRGILPSLAKGERTKNPRKREGVSDPDGQGTLFFAEVRSFNRIPPARLKVV